MNEMIIKLLEKQRYRNYHLDFSYISEYYYDLQVKSLIGDYNYVLTRKPFEKPFVNPDRGTDMLYAPHWENAEAYGIEHKGQLIAVIELWYEEWSSRMRVTELWINVQYRRLGIGRMLMDYAKEKAIEKGARLLFLETQTSNANAVAFYTAMGFGVIGYDTTCYSNNDVTSGEVRLELGFPL